MFSSRWKQEQLQLSSHTHGALRQQDLTSRSGVTLPLLFAVTTGGPRLFAGRSYSLVPERGCTWTTEVVAARRFDEKIMRVRGMLKSALNFILALMGHGHCDSGLEGTALQL